MRTTLDIADDVLVAVRAIAERDSTSVGAVVSTLVRQSLPGDGDDVTSANAEFGFRPFPKRGAPVTNELIDRLREDVG